MSEPCAYCGNNDDLAPCDREGLFATIDTLTEQVASLTARLTELEGADIALEDALAEMRRMREERDEERRKFDKQFAKAWDATDRALIAEQRVKELEGCLFSVTATASDVVERFAELGRPLGLDYVINRLDLDLNVAERIARQRPIRPQEVSNE